MSCLKIELKKSLAGRLKNQIATAESLGLRKINHSKIFTDNATLQGQLALVSHMVKVENV